MATLTAARTQKLANAVWLRVRCPFARDLTAAGQLRPERTRRVRRAMKAGGETAIRLELPRKVRAEVRRRKRALHRRPCAAPRRIHAAPPGDRPGEAR